MTGFDSVRVKSPYKIKIIKEIRIEAKPNEHGKLHLHGIVNEDTNMVTSINASFEDDIHVIDDNTGDTVFKGLISRVKTTNKNGVYYIDLEAISGSFKFDIEKKSRSFQDIEMDYPDLIKEAIKDYSGNGFINTIGDGVKIERPIFQYKETDWEFIRRMASRFHSVIVCDLAEKSPRFYFGFPKGKSYEMADNTPYTASKDLYAYTMAGGSEEGFHDTDFFYYEVECKDKYNIGDEIGFKNKKLYVSEVSAYTNKGILRYKYRLSRKEGIYQKEIYNAALKGVSLEGKVLEVKGELVRLHLDIDKEQPKSKAFWFPFVPPTGNIMYCMPIVDTNASLYISDISGDNAIILGCVRKNGESCEKTGNSDVRYFGTEHGSELEMAPTAISFTGGSKEPLKLSLEDSEGIKLTSHKKLTFGAKEEITFITPMAIKVNAASQLFFSMKDASSGFSMENEFHFSSGNVILKGSNKMAFPSFAQEAPPPAKKSSFSWGKLLKNVAIGLVVVAAVTVVAAATVATGGAALAAVGAVAMGASVSGTVGVVALGAAIGGTAAVASIAVKDVMRGEVSDARDYAIGGAREAFIGAVSGAIFGPVVLNTLKGVMLLGATTNTFESVLRQRMEGRPLNPIELLLDAGIGAATGGIFYGGGKLVSWVRNGGKKVAGEVAEEGTEKVAKETAKKSKEEIFSDLNKATKAEHDNYIKRFENGEITRKEMGPAVAGVYNEKTGKYFFRNNDPDGNLPEVIHPHVKDRIDNMPASLKESYIKTPKGAEGAGSHAECLALNDSLLDEMATKIGVNKSELTQELVDNAYKNGDGVDLGSQYLDVLNLKKYKTMPETGMHMPRCKHCGYVTEGVNVPPELKEVEILMNR